MRSNVRSLPAAYMSTQTRHHISSFTSAHAPVARASSPWRALGHPHGTAVYGSLAEGMRVKASKALASSFLEAFPYILCMPRSCSNLSMCLGPSTLPRGRNRAVLGAAVRLPGTFHRIAGRYKGEQGGSLADSHIHSRCRAHRVISNPQLQAFAMYTHVVSGSCNQNNRHHVLMLQLSCLIPWRQVVCE